MIRSEDEQRVDAIHAGNGVDIVHAFDILELGDDDCPPGIGAVPGHASGGTARRTAAPGIAAGAANVSAGFVDGITSLFGAADMRQDDPVAPQSSAFNTCSWLADCGRTRRQDADVECGAVKRRVFGVEDEAVETGQA